MGRRRPLPHARGDPGGASGPLAVLGVGRHGLRRVAFLQRRSPARRRARARAGRRAAGSCRARDGRGGGRAARVIARRRCAAVRRDHSPVPLETRIAGTRPPVALGQPRHGGRRLARRPARTRAGRPVGNRRVRLQHRAAAQPRRVRPRRFPAPRGRALGIIPARAGRWPGDPTWWRVPAADPRAGRSRLDAGPPLPGPARRAGGLRGRFHDAARAARPARPRVTGGDVPAHGHAALFRHRRPETGAAGVPDPARAGCHRPVPTLGRVVHPAVAARLRDGDGPGRGERAGGGRRGGDRRRRMDRPPPRARSTAWAQRRPCCCSSTRTSFSS